MHVQPEAQHGQLFVGCMCCSVPRHLRWLLAGMAALCLQCSRSDSAASTHRRAPPCHSLPPGFFTLGSRKAAPAPPVEEEEEEEEAPAPAKRGAFAFGSRRGGVAAAVAEAEAEAPPATRRIIRGRNPVAAPEEPKARPAPVQQQQKKEEGAAPKKSGGFLSFLGVSNETIYADE